MSSIGSNHLHFVLFPLMAPGHMNPMIDIARLLAQHGIIVSIVNTPQNAARFKSVLARAIQFGLQIRVIELPFPSKEAGLPEGCENIDMLPSLHMSINLFNAASLLHQPVDKLFQELNPPPSCIISDAAHPWTLNIATKYKVPRISFNGFCCFSMLCMHNIHIYKVLESLTSETEYFTVPGLPGNVEMSRVQLPDHPMLRNLLEFHKRMIAADKDSYGVIINTFKELEPAYVKEYKKARGNKVWCVGPVSLCNQDSFDKVQRGNKSSINEHECLKWLDSWDLGSVVYVCLGSLITPMLAQLVELGLGIESLNIPFIWVIKGGDKTKDLEKWILESGFEERTKERGLIIRGWAPQVLILSHPAVGGFLTHCGWNSTLEAISAGVPMVTWPLVADQFCNEKLVVQILNIGVSIGVEVPAYWGQEEQFRVRVTKEDILRSVNRLMKGDEGEEKRERAKKFAELAKRAIEDGGSSYLDIKLLIQDMLQYHHEQADEKSR